MPWVNEGREALGPRFVGLAPRLKVPPRPARPPFADIPPLGWLVLYAVAIFLLLVAAIIADAACGIAGR